MDALSRRLRAELGAGEGVTALLENSEKAAQIGGPPIIQVPPVSMACMGRSGLR